MRDIIADAFYVDTASSIADKAIIARNRTALATLDHTLITILAMADRGLAGDSASAVCAGHWLSAWAKGGAMLGHMSSRQAEVERKWRTAGMAVGYLKIRKSVEAGDRAAIDPWMDELADRVVADQGWPRKRNNHVYWAGFAAGAVGTATGAARHLAFSRRVFDAAMTDIRPDGTLAMELERRQKSLDYTNFALAPLIMAAELAALRIGMDMTMVRSIIWRAVFFPGCAIPKASPRWRMSRRWMCRGAGCLVGWPSTGCGFPIGWMVRRRGRFIIRGWGAT